MSRGTSTMVYKICSDLEWRDAVAAGAYAGSIDDRRDGFIHLSTAVQIAETARRHFAGKPGLVVVAFEAAALGDGLRWEPSRGGDLFPHLYGVLAPLSAKWVRAAPLDSTGVPTVPEGVE